MRHPSEVKIPSINLPQLLEDLAKSRPLFHSEADFQHALAWRLHEQHPGFGIRLEYPLPIPDERMYVDIWATAGDMVLALELKYKTRRIRATANGEAFDLTNQSAQDIGRYDTIKDICRLERLAGAYPGLTAYVVLLTNDSAYWTTARTEKTVDAGFRLHEGRTLCGELKWSTAAGPGTKKAREDPLQVSGSYVVAWRDYSGVTARSYGRFRYLLVPITPWAPQPRLSG
jgi:hypothetical protein